MIPGILKEKKYIISAVVLFVLIHILFFPLFFASVDEHEYLKNAFLLQEGTLTEPDLTEACAGTFNGEGYISHFFIGRSLFLIPFTLFGFGAAMLSGLIIHLLNFFVFCKIMKRMDFSPLYSLFYLLYPAFFWEARTLNSELLALTGILGGVYFYLSRKNSRHLLSGLIFGLAAFSRYEVALIIFPFYLIPLIKDRKKLLFLLLGIIPTAGLLLFANQSLYGGSLSTGYGDPTRLIGDIGQYPPFWANMGKFFLLLSVAYPLMLFSPLAEKRLRYETIIASIIFIVFYSQNTSISVFPTAHPTVFTAQLRYVIPLIGLLLISYPRLVEMIFLKLRLPRRQILAGAIVALFAVFAVASIVHSEFLDGRYAVFKAIYSHTEEGSLLIGSADDCNYVLNELFEERHYLNVNAQNLSIYTQDFDRVYVLDISYSTVDQSTERGAVAVAERQAIKDFINSTPSLKQVFSTTSPHPVTIYRLEKDV